MYYLVIIQNDSTQAVYSYETNDMALAAFHSELAYRGEGRNKTVCVILDDNGTLVTREVWKKSVDPVSVYEETE